MAKKIFAKSALVIMIFLLTAPMAFAATAAQRDQADNLLKTSGAFKAPALTPCIKELTFDQSGNPDLTKPGPDNGYVISIMEEPLNITPSGDVTTPQSDGSIGDKFVIRRCYRNTFQITLPEVITPKTDKTKEIKTPASPKTETMLATTCSQTAQNLTNPPNTYNAKYSCKEVQVNLSKGGTAGIYGYINMIYKWGASMVGIIAVTIIIGSGIQISASGGDSEAIGAAKKRILQSIIGIIVLFLSSLILYTINPTFFVNGG